MSLAVPAVAPFDLAHSLTFLQCFGPMLGEQGVTRDVLTKALSCGGQAVVVRVRQKGGCDRPMLDVDFHAARPLGEGRWRDVLARVRSFLSADEDLAPFYERAANDPGIADVVQALRGLHHVKFPSAFEAACWGVINQRIGQDAARAMKTALVRRAGARFDLDGVAHWAFPEPAAVADLGEAELAKLCPGGRRARAVLEVARAFASVDASFLHEAPIDRAREWLRAIHGVGPFTASFVLYRGLGRFDGAPLVAPKLVAIASERYGRALDARAVSRMADDYGPWGGHWMLYLWASSFLPEEGSPPGPGGEAHVKPLGRPEHLFEVALERRPLGVHVVDRRT
jgi:DNA-3-methyladenine glycosylase II